jgi:hypothetical protein
LSFGVGVQLPLTISQTVLQLAGLLVRRNELVTHAVRSADERADPLLLKLQSAHGELNARTHGRHLLHGGSQPAHLDEERRERVLVGRGGLAGDGGPKHEHGQERCSRHPQE